jgi:hypothetical protein
MTANDNSRQLFSSIDLAITGQAVTIRQPHRRFGRCHAEFVGHAGDGKHVIVRKHISSMYRSRYTKPLKVARADVMAVHLSMAQFQA